MPDYSWMLEYGWLCLNTPEWCLNKQEYENTRDDKYSMKNVGKINARISKEITDIINKK